MNDPDLDIEARLAAAAAASPTPALPPDTAALPWTIQKERRSPGFLHALADPRSMGVGIGRAAVSLVRLAATFAVAGALLVFVGQVRSSASAADFVRPQATASLAPGLTGPAGPEVVVVHTSGVVDSVMADYIAASVQRAENDNAAAVIIQLDTLGGAEDAMTAIHGSLNAKIPTIVWVGPSGAKAASAGTFITMSANLAYMADGTNIGAASPVAAGGGDIAATYGQTEADKVMHDALAMMRSYAQQRHPDAVAWAVTTVQNAQSYTAQEALGAKAINGIANSIDDVINQADGQTVTTTAGQVTLHTKGATVVTVDENFIQSFLHALDDPNIAFILLVLGILFVAIELFHPTLLFGLIGAVSLVLSFYGSGNLPLNALGVVLVAIGVGMLILETSIPSHGLLTIGGLAAFVVGAVAFYGSPGPFEPSVEVAWPIIAAMTAIAAAYGLILVGTLIQMRRQPVPVGLGLVGTGTKAVGAAGVVQADLSPLGTVYVGRESWTARSRDGSSLPRGSNIRVIGQEGLILVVEKIPE
jgi:membrane-bound serine protease (ClpP class)